MKPLIVQQKLKILKAQERMPSGRYRKRTNDFVAPNWDLNLDTMEGHSYRWYKLVKKIKGRVVMNSYRYSPSTCKHIWHVEYILRSLGIKFVQLEAPRGLQDLGVAIDYATKQLARAKLANKFARTPHHYEGYWALQIKLAKSFGARATITKDEAEKRALEERSHKLGRLKTRRLELKRIKEEKRLKIIATTHYTTGSHLKLVEG